MGESEDLVLSRYVKCVLLIRYPNGHVKSIAGYTSVKLRGNLGWRYKLGSWQHVDGIGSHKTGYS